jgi:hypothetical protein
MANRTHFRLLGFANFEASRRFLHGLEEDILVSRWERSPKISVQRPEGLDTDDAIRAELELPCDITVVSAHAGYFDDGVCFCGQDDTPVLAADSVCLGATGMVLIDACCTTDLVAALKDHAQPGSLLVGLGDCPSPETWARDSVLALGAVIRELCYPGALNLGPDAVRRAVGSVNAQIMARNLFERARGVTNPKADRPLIDIHEC